ncbi:LysM peptidoglycan-binding domain-containing protein [Metabacillus litoralis]|uniref:LysM peptidoglycan-binding domain-containing protein n=1 Tax=Metabacillus litoralis TaxID=152268 RepID=UPI0020402772|nr:LysM peptidoglycan-binding domain-containing protein [Metabacillus litoralis]MCM3412131.1 LysM peptidoglycan-binding domain-containing protein [Metabacillus litoralis]
MNFLHKYGIEKQSEGVILTLYVSDFDTEFANELGTSGTATHQDEISEYAKQRFPNLKINAIKIVAGGILIGMFSFTSLTQSKTTVKAATQDHTLLNTLTYSVKSGDSLSLIAKKYHLTTNEIKSFNQLTTDTIKVGQVLKIPLLKYDVKSGDSLSGLAKQFGTTIDRIKQLNSLTSDVIYLGQSLYVPVSDTVSTLPSSTTNKSETSTYIVQSGDSLSVIAKRFQTTVLSIKEANSLTTDIIRVGQTLNVPGKATELPPVTTQPSQEITKYTVVSGDSLSVIAKKFNTNVEAIKKQNSLTTDIIYLGQLLLIPSSSEAKSSEAKSTVENETASGTYKVVAGDTLSGIAKAFGLSVSFIKEINNLTSDTIYLGQTLQLKKQPTTINYVVKSGDTLSEIAKEHGTTTEEMIRINHLNSTNLAVGQVLTINSTNGTASATPESSITYRTHTVQSGDNIWNLSVKYGIPQAELLRANNLTTSSRLSIGQKLKIPVHQIAVQKTVSERHGEYLTWWTEAQYVFPIGKVATVIDFQTGKSFKVKRTVGANHADSETLTTTDTNIAKSIWGGFSWSTRAVIVEVDGRKIAASMSFYPHDVDYVRNNGINGHFDIHFKDSTRHKDGKIDPYHQEKIRIAAGVE